MIESASPLSTLFPGLDRLPGSPSRDLLGTPLHRFLAARDRLSWPGLGAMSPQEVALVPSVGPIRTRKVLSGLAALMTDVVAAADIPAPPGDEQGDQLLAALLEIAAWAVGSGRGGSVLDGLTAAVTVAEADAPVSALQSLGRVDAFEVADPERVAVHDPVATAERLIAGFDERERATLDRLLDFDGSAPTLQEIGGRFDVSRERIRQIEERVKSRLDEALGAPATRSLVAAADRLRDRLGAAIPADQLSSEFAEYPPDLLDRLILYLAGPYRFDGDWYVLTELAPFGDTVLRVFDGVQERGTASLAAFSDALLEQGVRDDHVAQATEHSQLRVVDETVIDWRGSMGAKAARVLRLSGQPMLLPELAAILQPASERGMTNQIQSSSEIVRVGVRRYGLAEWNLAEFGGVAPAMAERLADGPMPVDDLAKELAEEFGVSTNSVGILSSTHPAFLREGGLVMLRPEDRPYVPSDDLERTRGCYVVDGLWSWRVPVDHDLLRGSGRAIPEAFAVHLGASPLASGSVDSPAGPVGVYWRQQPAIGSLRALARSVDAVEGDWLFVRRTTPSSIDVRVLRTSDLPADPEGRLRALVGAADHTAPLENVLADALGMRGSINHDLTEEREVLEARREHDLLELLDAVGSDPG